MNWKPLCVASAVFATLTLASCGWSTNKNGTTIKYPTVTEMEKHDAEWGAPVKLAPGHAEPATQSSSAAPHAAATPVPFQAPAEPAQPAAVVTPQAIPPLLR